MNIDSMIENIITEYSLKEDYNTIKDILIINRNKDDDIIDIDYDLQSLYTFSSKITDKLKKDFKLLEKGKNNILLIPYGMSSNNILFSNLGPKIPIKIKFIGSILTGVKTKVTDYGINNSLIEVYTTISISTLVITPVDRKRDTRNYEILVSSKIIEGKVPEIYSGKIEKKSNLTKQIID